MKMFIKTLIILFSIPALSKEVPSNADFQEATEAVYSYLLNSGIEDLEILCEDANYSKFTKEWDIRCNVKYTESRTDTIDLEEEGVFYKEQQLTCSFTYNYELSTSFVSETGGECY